MGTVTGPGHTAGIAAAPLAHGRPVRVRIRLWDLPTRLFHWSLAAVVIVSVISGQTGGDWMEIHGIAGLAVIGLVVFRLVWGLIGATHARFVNFVPTPASIRDYLQGRWRGVGHNPLGALAVFGLLALLAVQGATGLFANDDIAYTGPLISLVGDALAEDLTHWHHRVSDYLLILIGLHVVAIVFYAWFKKTNLVKPMVTGYQDVESGEPTRHGGWIAFLVSVMIAAAAVWLASGALLPKPAAAPAVSAPPKPAAW